ncbi:MULTISPECIES: 3-deoxy-manno-octulosonate-8-phosphatase KdsC [unclassified Colwellia]|uniref:3-deoxy-manno-octulosonate-8-phosphatase KdsC n=1 Tax=unclassified Colwellia TaxID=196834 RepID=UPI0015F509CE|nr:MULTISPECIES: 3-deoxy-manno-octulosonate-8-phosphatase KdsC [unclassified Colwellia]MBA6232717.1 3-deoxy-manno-octulosonate-8-phosphatase KdsC [Colwellia sp. MB02u-7]MBA6236195.1 3-deoxy-manno-octulosonate-8-phosphatase KdsC [Colwellia sp. MB02u-11]MBA6256553.1 3-deoxy-manno-octulosonate-8-phosphatase KdsC [Colwellia sp. MB3u-28]MBA6261268.1 3-deoxy-manno-octulosonate-8-phosphatase KdsC [Colwellia sp. MB3u-41]MBA6298405.1 3-deoxy-manno-octulosonate-8-phosphatase KdsC [Colwellia sp. MB3u-22]
MHTYYGEITDPAFNAMKKIKLLICDIDGVFSDGRIYLGNHGEELKAFHTKDGYGVKALGASGVDVAVITGRTSNIVATRMSALNVKYIVQGEENKLPALKKMVQQLNLALDEIAYIGDDMPDYECIDYVGFGISVQDAHPSILSIANYTTFNRGGFGAVREICDLIMLSQNTLENASGASI